MVSDYGMMGNKGQASMQNGMDDMKDTKKGMDESVMVPTSMLGGPVKVGDEIVMLIKNVKGNMAEMMYAPPKGSEGSDKQPVTPEQAKSMPLNKLEEAIGTAEREGQR